LLAGLEAWHAGFQEIAVIGPPTDPQTQRLLRTIYGAFVPNKVVALLDPAWPNAAEIARRVPLLTDKKMLDKQTNCLRLPQLRLPGACR